VLPIWRLFWSDAVPDRKPRSRTIGNTNPDYPNVERNISTIIPQRVSVESSVCLGRDLICWMQSNNKGETLHKKLVQMQFDTAYNRILAGDDLTLDTTDTDNYLEIKKHGEESTLHRIAKVDHFLEMWQSDRHVWPTQEESCAQNKQMSVVWYFSDTEDIVEASWLLLHHNSAPAVNLSERSPLPPAFSEKVLLRGLTQIVNFGRIGQINQDPVQCQEGHAPECIPDTEDWLNSNGIMDNLNYTEEYCSADIESDIERGHGVDDSECPAQRHESTARNVPGLVLPTWKSKPHTEKMFVTVNPIEMRSNMGVKKR